MTFPAYFRRSPPFCKPKSSTTLYAFFYCFVCIPCVPVGMWSHVRVQIWRSEINISSFLAAPHLIFETELGPCLGSQHRNSSDLEPLWFCCVHGEALTFSPTLARETSVFSRNFALQASHFLKIFHITTI